MSKINHVSLKEDIIVVGQPSKAREYSENPLKTARTLDRDCRS